MGFPVPSKPDVAGATENPGRAMVRGIHDGQRKGAGPDSPMSVVMTIISGRWRILEKVVRPAVWGQQSRFPMSHSDAE